MDSIENKIAFLGSELIAEIIDGSTLQDIPKGTEILREDQYIKVIPLVISGLVRVFTRFNDRELLLYYIQSNESCIMSFSASLNNEPSKVYATTEEDSQILLLPVDKLPLWLKIYPELNKLFYQQYNIRYTELLDTIQHVLFDKMDKRLYDYLKEKTRMTNTDILKISHSQIANELGTVREVISRVMKKLESEGKVKQLSTRIQIFE